MSEKSSLRTIFYGLKGVLRGQITFSGITEFVSRRGADFSASAKIGGDLEVQFTFSKILDFVRVTAHG